MELSSYNKNMTEDEIFDYCNTCTKNVENKNHKSRSL